MPKVLLVEDDPAIAEMYKIRFEAEGFSVIRVLDGDEALTISQKELPDIILLDVMMPKKDGTEVLIELKKDPKTKAIPVIFLTNLGGRMEDTKAAQDLGAEDLIFKALTTPQEVVEKIKKVLDKHRPG